MDNLWPDVIERKVGEDSGAGSQPLDERVLEQIREAIVEKMGVGARNLRTHLADPDYLEMELSILYPERKDAETLAAIVEAHLKPIRWSTVMVFLHPKTNRLILEARRRRVYDG